MRTSIRRFAGCLTMVLLACIAVVALVLWGPDVSIPWAGTRITLPDNTGYFTYRQKGVHYSRVLIPAGSSVQERWLPYRPCYGSINVYYYSTEGQRCIRLQDEFNESLIDLQSAKTFLLVRSPDGQLFRGEIFDCEDGSKGSSINGSPWKVTVEDRIAENITGSDFATNRGLYLGRIEVSENKESPSDPPLIQFVTAKESPALVIKTKGDAGSQPSGKRGDVQRPSVFIEPKHLNLTNFLQSVRFNIVFSNSTDRLVVLAKDDIDEYENMTIVSGSRLARARSKDQLVHSTLFNPAGDGSSIEVVKLNPNQTLSVGLDLINLASCGVDPASYTDEIYVVFYGWPNNYGIGYKINDFPKDLRPYVWRDAVTSSPVRVEFVESGIDYQMRLHSCPK